MWTVLSANKITMTTYVLSQVQIIWWLLVHFLHEDNHPVLLSISRRDECFLYLASIFYSRYDEVMMI